MIKHATAGAFVFCRFTGWGWRLGLIEHPRLRRWMAMVGHVANDECQAQAAIREVEEESGLSEVCLLEVAAPPPSNAMTRYDLAAGALRRSNLGQTGVLAQRPARRAREGADAIVHPPLDTADSRAARSRSRPAQQ